MFNVFVLSFKTLLSFVYSVTGIAMPLSILGISWSFISSIYSMCVCVCVCVCVCARMYVYVYVYIYIYIYIKQVSVQAPFRHRHRFKSIDLAPVSKKKKTIPNPTTNTLLRVVSAKLLIQCSKGTIKIKFYPHLLWGRKKKAKENNLVLLVMF